MQNLILFVQRYYHFFLFLIFEIISFYYLVQSNVYHNVAGYDMFNQATGKVYQTVDDIRGYFALREVNEQLVRENAVLRSRERLSFEAMAKDTFTVNDTLYHQVYNYIPARVVNNSVSRRSNYLTLNRGVNDGIEPGDGVICGDGIVGVIINVSEHYSTAMSLLTTKWQISPKISDNNYFGSLVWDGRDPRYAQLKEINKHVPIKNGQQVVTSSFSPIFPEGIMIGTIEESSIEGGDNFYKIRVRLSTNFENLSAVYIVKNLMKKEIEALESKTNNAP